MCSTIHTCRVVARGLQTSPLPQRQPLPGGISQRVNYGASDSSGVGHAYTAQEMAPPPIDEFAQCDRRFMNLSFKYSPGSPQLQTPLPVGCMVRPLAPTRAADGPPVPVVNFGDAGVVRCKRCGCV